MRWNKRIRIEQEGVNLAADINAGISVNQGGSGATTEVDSISCARVVQDSRRTADASSDAEEPPEQRRAEARTHEKEDPDDH